MELSLFPQENTRYRDTEFWSAKQMEKAYKCFARVLKHRDINKMDKNLYEFLHLHCGFIAHYSIRGFKSVYSGQNFRDFVEHFDKRSPNFCNIIIWTADYADVIKDMVELATSMAPQIYAELDADKKAKEIAYCKAIAAKYGLRVEA